MRTDILHSIALWLALTALPMLAACSGQEDFVSDEAVESGLYLNVAAMAGSRASAADLSDNERMHTIRVIVLHADGKVEHNVHYTLTGYGSDSKLIYLKVSPNEKKKIFLFANEESVSQVEGVTDESLSLTGFFDKYPQEVAGFETAVNALYFAPDYSKPIPMSSMYEIDFKTGYQKEAFYVVRVATKFMVNFYNWRGEQVIVKSISLASHADRNYLMAHVDNSDRNRQLFAGKTWIEWLKEVSDASPTDNPQWLKDYQLPPQAGEFTYTYSAPVTIGGPTIDVDNYPANSKPGEADKVPVFYLPESKNIKSGSTDGTQEYTMTVIFEGRNEPFVFAMPRLEALFRNTYVVVNITLYKNLEITVDVIPYSEVILEPTFGLG